MQISHFADRFNVDGVPGYFSLSTAYGFHHLHHCTPIPGERFAVKRAFVGSVPYLPSLQQRNDRCEQAIRDYLAR